MVEGESGILACARLHERLALAAEHRESCGCPATGSRFAYSGDNPERLRGPQHHFAWADELAKWARPRRRWDNLQMGLRLGDAPRALVTTTPRAEPLLKRLHRGSWHGRTSGRTDDNPYLPAAFIEAMTTPMAGRGSVGRSWTAS